MAATAAAHAIHSPLLLDEAPRRFGPLSRRLLARLVVVVVLVETLGTVLVVTGSRTWTAFGTSLVFPGAGFLYTAWPLLFVATAVALLVALIVWWGASAHLAIPFVWLLSAAGAAALADGPRLFVPHGATWGWAVPAAYALLVATVGVMVLRFERGFREKRATIAAANEYLAAPPVFSRAKVVRDPDPMDVELLRWVYAVADQPDDELVGLDWGEQFHSGTQLRYQLNSLCWALSLYAANFVPNAQAQAEAALARLVVRHTDLRVWRYWRTLNLLGNFDGDPDPIRRDNIMFSAFLGDVLNIYEAATGSDRFDRPGSLTFVWKDGRAFEYDHHSIAAAVRANYDRSRLGFYPCEPGWSFTVCNVMGAQALFGHDRLHGTDDWTHVKPRWVRTLDEEYSTPDGSYAHIKSNLVGLAWDTGEVPGGHYLAAGSHRFADILPEHAYRAALLERRKAEPKMAALAGMVHDGRLEMELPTTLERNGVIRSALPAWNAVIGGARLVGEQELMLAALDASSRQCATGQRWPERPLHSGVPGLGGHMIVRWSSPMGAAQLNVRGYVPPSGPIVTDAPWDDLLFVEARTRDGEDLVLRVEPRHDAPVEAATIRFGHLRPGVAYRFSGTDGLYELIADDEGAAAVCLPVVTAVRMELVPGGAS